MSLYDICAILLVLSCHAIAYTTNDMDLHMGICYIHIVHMPSLLSYPKCKLRKRTVRPFLSFSRRNENCFSLPAMYFSWDGPRKWASTVWTGKEALKQFKDCFSISSVSYGNRKTFSQFKREKSWNRQGKDSQMHVKLIEFFRRKPNYPIQMVKS